MNSFIYSGKKYLLHDLQGCLSYKYKQSLHLSSLEQAIQAHLPQEQSIKHFLQTESSKFIISSLKQKKQ
jgi:hypothetical protein